LITVILAGGFGSRLSEYTEMIPKPMVEICGEPIILRILKHYSKFGYKKFIIATGYKSEVIKDYFQNNRKNLSDIEVKTIFTGKNSLTGTRVKKLSNYLKDENFFLTYGDGLSTIDIKKLLKFHKKNKKLVTITAVHPPARFGELILNKAEVTNFEEKPQLQKGWINGGFFVLNKGFLNLITKKNEMLERGPIKKAVKLSQVCAYKYEGFWHCIDTKRDKDLLEELLQKKRIKL
tara:strand:- start:1510 stop:2211 length:702 start_codon:yes stop_codon:yes gene_type:complete